MVRSIGYGVLLAPLLAAIPLAGWAQDDSLMAQLIPITVVASRVEQPADAVAKSTDSKSADDIAHQQSNDLGAVLEDLLNVSLTGSPRPSGEEIQIRGLSGNRVLKLVDGVRLSLSAAHLSDLFIDPGLIQKVEVERGPASVLWGSGALGGVVSVQTKDAADLLDPDQSLGAQLNAGYQTASNGWSAGATVYGMLADNLDGLLYVDHRDNNDFELGNGSKLPHSAYRQSSLLAKTKYYPAPSQSIGLIHRSERLKGDAPSNPASPVDRENPLLSRETALDTTQLKWRVKPTAPAAVDLLALVYHTRTKVDETHFSDGSRDHTKVNTVGMDIANTSRFTLGPAGSHMLTYGANGFGDRANAGSTSGPNGKRRLIGIFAQDAVTWGDWTVTPGLRYDWYHSQSSENVAPDQDARELSSQLGIVWQTTDWLSIYANYAQAFRAPSLEELYAVGTHFGANKFVPNPDLKPEKAANKEVGLRANWSKLLAPDDQLRLNASVFRNDVENFIDTIVEVVPLPGPPFVGGTTRSKNVTDARLEGFEATIRYSLKGWFAGLGYGQTHGTNKTKNQPLTDIAPHRWVLRTGVRNLPWDGRIALHATLAESQNRVPPGTEKTAGYTVYDLLSSWTVRDGLRLHVGIHNLTDKAYRQHNAVIEQTGRNIATSLSWSF